MDHRLIEGLMEVVVPAVREYVDRAMTKAIAPLMERIAELEGRPTTKGEPGKAITIDDVRPLIDEAFAKVPVPQNVASVTVEDVERVVVEKVEAAVAALQAPIDGKDASSEVIKAAVLDVIAEVLPGEISTAIEALPKPKEADAGEIANLLIDLMPVPVDGKSVTLDDVRPLLEELVAALPVPSDGKDINPAEVALMVSTEVAKTLEAWPRPVDGKSVTLDEVRHILEEMVAALPTPENGKDADPADVAALIIDDVAKLIPTPQDGKSVSVDDVLPVIEEMIERKVAALPVPKDGKDGVSLAGALIDRAGELVVTLSDGSTKTLGVVVGKDVDPDSVANFIRDEVSKIPHPKDGTDGVGFDDLDLVDVDGDLKLRFTRGDIIKDFDLPLPTYRGVWEDREFKKGATVTWAGSLWISERDTQGRPDAPDGGWRLAVKRGRDGASAFDVARKNGFKGSESDWLNSLRPKPLAPVKAV